MVRGDVVKLKGEDYIFMVVEEVQSNEKDNCDEVFCVWLTTTGDVIRDSFPDYVLEVMEDY